MPGETEAVSNGGGSVGFSVSGSFAILVLASFIAFGMLHTASANTFERVSDATKETYDDELDMRNTVIDIVHVDDDGNTLDVNVTNNGTTALTVNDTDLIVDNVYQRPDDSDVEVQVVENPGSQLWLPGQTLAFTVTSPGTPSRVKVVTEYGVADAEVVP